MDPLTDHRCELHAHLRVCPASRRPATCPTSVGFTDRHLHAGCGTGVRHHLHGDRRQQRDRSRRQSVVREPGPPDEVSDYIWTFTTEVAVAANNISVQSTNPIDGGTVTTLPDHRHQCHIRRSRPACAWIRPRSTA
ncbi:MAG: hypothetical protein U5R48_02530 [Gammaproteobacteria bacterium]|nr:hypothetical protein [Gammaproteobacteria bacterium]